MIPDVKPQARTRLARAAVVEAAATLFLERGYAATTIDAISGASGVPGPTVYRLFSSKLGVLKALLDRAITGDDRTIPLPDREHVRALRADPDPRRQLAGFAAIARDVNGRGGNAYRILASAAGSDQHAAELLADYTRQRQDGQGQFACSLARLGALRAGMSERDAADIFHAIASPDVYQLLVADRGWSPDRYQEWLTATLVDQLLPRADRETAVRGTRNDKH
ncbi:MAG TPA: helix-turn-helix domain-containing protein [Trebonia sp.]|nr:helix-turn-helix domain-containing protein [Trebonia sp.]